MEHDYAQTVTLCKHCKVKIDNDEESGFVPQIVQQPTYMENKWLKAMEAFVLLLQLVIVVYGVCILIYVWRINAILETEIKNFNI
jgi:hypothetical protein